MSNNQQSSQHQHQQHQQLIRPTEAQLRWAQFHHRRRAIQCRQDIERIWQLPAQVKDVPEALSEDGNTTEESFELPRPRPKISRGRRALLRVSKRSWARRREYIMKHGFRSIATLQDGYGSNSDYSDSDNEDEEEDALAAIFAEEAYLRKRRKRHHSMRRRRHGHGGGSTGGEGPSTDERERVRRFEAAFHSMMMRMAATVKSPEIEAPSKIWTRPSSMGIEQIMDYSELTKWGMPSQRKSGNMSNATIDFAPLDRGASWLVHLPAISPRNQNQPLQQHPLQLQGRREPQPLIDDFEDTYSDFPLKEWDEDLPPFKLVPGSAARSNAAHPSPMRRTFSNIVDRLQQQLNNRQGGEDEDDLLEDYCPKMMRLSKYFQPAQLDQEQGMREEKKDDTGSECDNYNGSEKAAVTVSPSASHKVDGSSTPHLLRAFLQGDDEEGNGELNNHQQQQLNNASQELDAALMSHHEGVTPGGSTPLRRGHGTGRGSNRQVQSQELEAALAFESPYPVLHERLSSLRKLGCRSSIFVNSVLEQWQEEDEYINSPGGSSRNLLRDLEPDNPGLSKKLFTLYLEETGCDLHHQEDARQHLIEAARQELDRYAQRFLWEQKQGTFAPTITAVNEKRMSYNSNGNNNGSFVNRLVAQLEEAVAKGEEEALVSADGKLQRATFARLIRRYLVEARQDTSSLQNRSKATKEGTGPPGHQGRVSDRYLSSVQSGKDAEEVADFGGGELEPASQSAVAAIVDSFLSKLEQAPEEDLSQVLNEDGNLNGAVFEQLVARYLAEATGNSQEAVLVATNLEGLENDNRHAGSIPTGASAPHDEQTKVNPIFVKNFVAQIERAAEVEELFTPEGKLVKPAFEKILLRYVQQDAPKTHRAFSMDVRSPLMLARARQSARKPSRFGQDSLDNSGPPMLDSPTVVRRFLCCMEKESEGVVKSIRKPNGKLDAAVFESLVDRCLIEAMAPEEEEKHQPLEKNLFAGENELRKSKLFVNDESMDDFVDTFVDHCVNVSRECLFVNQSKMVDKGELRDVVVSCLQRQQQNLRPNGDPKNLESFVDSFVGLVEEECMLGSFRGAVMGEDHILLEDLARHWTKEAAADYNLHQVDSDTRKLTDSPVSSSLPTARTYLGSNSSYSPEAPDQKPNDFLSEASDHAPKNSLGTNADEGQVVTRYESGGAAGVLANKFAGSMSGKVGGFMKMLYNASQHSEDEELQAVAAFRRTQGDRPPDDTSSFSSVLPDGIKKAVQSFRHGHLPPNNEVEEEEVGDNVTDISSVPEGSSVIGSLDGLSNNHRPQFSPERLKTFHHNVMEKSVLTGGDQNRSIIDTDGSEASRQGMDPAALSNLLLSPTILTKRHQQAIRAVEIRNWDQVEYLISANPWLAEMTDLKTNQYLVHKVALYGTGAPDHINTDLIRINPGSIHKFDNDGNLPLHMAAASANINMIGLLGDRFASGASVRNEDGMLPLHLVILALASSQTREKIIELGETPVAVMKKVLDYFPGAVAVGDDDGSLPIHTAVAAVKGDDCVDIVNLLLVEAERQVKDSTVQFRNKYKLEEGSDEVSVGTESLDHFNNDDVLHCNLVQNENGDMPLMTAIQSRAGWKVIDALVAGPGGPMAALSEDPQQNNALHRLVSAKDSASVLCILKAAPEAASKRNEDNMLPIEIACRNGLPREVVLALVLVDLPFDLDDTNCEGRRDGYGGSWFFLACECDDHYVGVVEEVVSLCSYSQARELCFFDNGSGETLLARATPKCRGILQRTLRFLGRFEFQTLSTENDLDSRMFTAIDFGSRDDPFPEGRPVVLKCYISEQSFEKETFLFRELDLDSSLLEGIEMFGVGEDGMPTSTGAKQHCISIEQPDLTLCGVVGGMLKNKGCQTDPTVRKRYAEKVFAVLRVVAKSLRYLHGVGIVHGEVCSSSCGKYGNKWKLSNLLGIRRVGDGFNEERLFTSAPPESINAEGGSIRAGFEAQPSIDTWAYGKLSFEVLVGQPLFSSLNTEDLQQRNDTLKRIFLWNDQNLDAVRQRLKEAHVSDAGVSLILECLLPQPERRPSMAEILTRPFWNEIRRPGRSKKEE